jgi:GT2 family glycosyltransferase
VSVTVSIVTITRNDLTGVQATVASVRGQREVGIQHIVVDGASTDGTPQWLEDQSWSDGSLFISEPDLGIYDAMNKGAAFATGDLLVFMNGGDRFPKASTAADVVASWDELRWRWAYGITVLGSTDDAGVQVSRIHQMAPFSRVRLGLGLAAIPHQAMWMTTELFRELGGFRLESGLSADMDLCWRAAQLAEPHLIPEILSVAQEGGVSANQAPGHYARAMRKNVKASGASVLGNKALDPIASAGVVALTSVVQIVPTLWAKRS